MYVCMYVFVMTILMTGTPDWTGYADHSLTPDIITGSLRFLNTYYHNYQFLNTRYHNYLFLNTLSQLSVLEYTLS